MRTATKVPDGTVTCFGGGGSTGTGLSSAGGTGTGTGEFTGSGNVRVLGAAEAVSRGVSAAVGLPVSTLATFVAGLVGAGFLAAGSCTGFAGAA
ncbi:MAG TPA: hypothetical protein VFU37_14210 [Pyrinomonadaceae bacterium]|nr:hypothetical protein [Pyrinomonadaceae bacterium]